MYIYVMLTGVIEGGKVLLHLYICIYVCLLLIYAFVTIHLFMARSAIPMIAFHGIDSIYMYIYIYMLVSFATMRCIHTYS